MEFIAHGINHTKYYTTDKNIILPSPPKKNIIKKTKTAFPQPAFPKIQKRQKRITGKKKGTEKKRNPGWMENGLERIETKIKRNQGKRETRVRRKIA